MPYRQKIREFILQGKMKEMMKWISSFPDMDRIELMQEVKEVLLELNKDAGGKHTEFIAKFDELLANYQEKVLDVQLASLKEEMREKEIEQQMNKLREAYQNLRSKLIDNLNQGVGDLDAIKNCIAGLIENEKKHGFYDPEEWKELPPGML